MAIDPIRRMPKMAYPQDYEVVKRDMTEEAIKSSKETQQEQKQAESKKAVEQQQIRRQEIREEEQVSQNKLREEFAEANRSEAKQQRQKEIKNNPEGGNIIDIIT